MLAGGSSPRRAEGASGLLLTCSRPTSAQDQLLPDARRGGARGRRRRGPRGQRQPEPLPDARGQVLRRAHILRAAERAARRVLQCARHLHGGRHPRTPRGGSSPQSSTPPPRRPLTRPGPPSAQGKLWRLKEAGLWNLEPTGYFEEGRYLTFSPPEVPRPLPPAAIEPYEQCVARQKQGKADPTYDGWWAPAQPAPCAKTVRQYQDKNGDQGVTIGEAISMAPRLQAHLKMAARYLVALRDGMAVASLRSQPLPEPTSETPPPFSPNPTRSRGCSTAPSSFPPSSACATALSGPTSCPRAASVGRPGLDAWT